MNFMGTVTATFRETRVIGRAPGQVFFLDDSVKQKVVALSSCEAE